MVGADDCFVVQASFFCFVLTLLYCSMSCYLISELFLRDKWCPNGSSIESFSWGLRVAWKWCGSVWHHQVTVSAFKSSSLPSTTILSVTGDNVGMFYPWNWTSLQNWQIPYLCIEGHCHFSNIFICLIIVIDVEWRCFMNGLIILVSH